MKRDTIIIEDKAVSVTGNDVWMTATEIAGLFHTTVPAVNAGTVAWNSSAISPAVIHTSLPVTLTVLSSIMIMSRFMASLF